jgi:hypothetical protein
MLMFQLASIYTALDCFHLGEFQAEMRTEYTSTGHQIFDVTSQFCQIQPQECIWSTC